MASSKINIDLVLNTKGFRPLGRINGQLGEFEKSLESEDDKVVDLNKLAQEKGEISFDELMDLHGL